MKPVLTVAEMREADRRAPVPDAVLVGRAGHAVAARAVAMLTAARPRQAVYGARVVVVAGKGNNGADGRVAAAALSARGAKVEVRPAAERFEHLPACDLAIDAAYGTGFRGTWLGFDAGDAPVLAVDIPSGVDGDTGSCDPDSSLWADETVTFAALKPGLLLADGRERAGRVHLADIGLPIGRPAIHLVEDADVAKALVPRPPDSHKWQRAVYVAAGAAGMLGAPTLVARAAMRAGAGYVVLGIPGHDPALLPPGEWVGQGLPAVAWDAAVLEQVERCRALVLGPGLGRSDEAVAAIRRLAANAPVPLVLDADGINALGGEDELASIAHGRSAPTIITPHDGEFARLTGSRPSAPGADRIGLVRALASRTGAVVLLKGPTTIVGAPDGKVLLAAAGTPALATAGTGDVLSGIIGAFLAGGLDALPAGALAAHVHGAAARTLGLPSGLVAGDLPDLVAHWLSGPGWPGAAPHAASGPAATSTRSAARSATAARVSASASAPAAGPASGARSRR